MLEVWANLDLQLPLSRVAAEARRAERLGFDMLCVPDLMHDGIARNAWRRDSMRWAWWSPIGCPGCCRRASTRSC